MNVWILTLWITFKAADGGMTVVAEIPTIANNRLVCEEISYTMKREMMLHGIPEVDEEGKDIILYPAKIKGRCNLK